MIINGPNIKKGSVYSQDIYLQDIVPTTLDLANISVPDHVDFKSFYNILFNNNNCFIILMLLFFVLLFIYCCVQE